MRGHDTITDVGHLCAKFYIKNLGKIVPLSGRRTTIFEFPACCYISVIPPRIRGTMLPVNWAVYDNFESQIYGCGCGHFGAEERASCYAPSIPLFESGDHASFSFFRCLFHNQSGSRGPVPRITW